MKNYGLNQKQVAELLGVTPAAVCQYLSNKRGYYNITDDDILHEIEKSIESLTEIHCFFSLLICLACVGYGKIKSK